jgi:hypothetical protein
VVADHIVARPHSPVLTAADVPSNLRALCQQHDAQVKERRGVRRNDGEFFLRGADCDGWPLDPKRR